MMRRSVRVGVRFGLWCGRLDRSPIAAVPAVRYRSAHRFAVVGETWNRSAARRSGHPSSTTHRASRNRPSSDSGALRWDTKTSGVNAFLDSSHFTRRSSSCHLATPSPTSVVSTTRFCLEVSDGVAPLRGATPSAVR